MMKYFGHSLKSVWLVTSFVKFVFASNLSKPKIRNKAGDFPKPITSQTLLIEGEGGWLKSRR